MSKLLRPPGLGTPAGDEAPVDAVAAFAARGDAGDGEAEFGEFLAEQGGAVAGGIEPAFDGLLESLSWPPAMFFPTAPM